MNRVSFSFYNNKYTNLYKNYIIKLSIENILIYDKLKKKGTKGI